MKSRFIWMVLILFLYSVGANASGKGRFLSWGIDAIRNIEKTSQEDSDEVKTLKLKPIVQAIDLLDQTIEIKDDISNLLVEQDLFYMEIYEVFQGDFKKAADFYWASTLGKHKVRLFLESGTGKSETIQVLKEDAGEALFISDRVYESKLAFNSKVKTLLKRFDVPSMNRVIVVNQLVQDFGAALQEKGIQKEGKKYHPVDYDLVVDMYQKIEDQKFLYCSFSSYLGQVFKTPYQSLNVAKGLGNILSFGSLQKKLRREIQEGAVEAWQKRKKLLQE